MATNTLLKYLRTILKLETDLRTLSVSMKKNRQQVAKFSQTYVVTKPKIDCYGHGIYGFLWDCFISLIVSAIPFGISIYLFISIQRKLVYCDTDTFTSHLVFAIDTMGSRSVFLILSTLVGIVMFCSSMGNLKDERKQIPEKLRQYEKDVAENERQMQANRKALTLVNQDYEILRQRYNKTASLLQKYYDLNVIYPKYRGIVPVAMFVQYLESGIVYQLEGPNGAYSRYEDELFRQLIINKLDVIVTRLDDIRSTQYELANSLEKSNQQIMELNSHAEIQAYNTMQTNAEVKALKDYTIFRDLLR